MSWAPWRRLPIRLRMAAWYAALLVILVGATGLFLVATLDGVLEEQVDAALRLRASRVEREITTGDDDQLDPGDVAASLLELAPLEEFSAPGIYVQVRDAKGTVIAASANLPRGELPVTSRLVGAALAGTEAFETVPIGPEEVRVLAWPVDPAGPVVGVVVVGQSLRFLDVTREGVVRLILVATGIAAGAALAGGWWLTARGLGPVSEITQVARTIAATGRFDRRIDRPPADDELGALVTTFNDMLARLERTFRLQREFLEDASHELRGPLMVIRGNLDLLRLGLPETERRTSVREATEEVERMSRLAADLLYLAAVDAEETLAHEIMPFDDVIRAIVDRARTVDDGRHAVILGAIAPTTVQGDRARLEQLVWSLLENALRYTPHGGQIDVSLTAQDGRCELRVDNTGPGIAPEHLPRIFERFYRVEKSRSRRDGGTGLGLAIVRRVAEAHGGSVTATSEVGRGASFTVTLPAEGYFLGHSPEQPESASPI